MDDRTTLREAPLFEWEGGVARYRGRLVEHRDVTIAGLTLRLACMKDAADLLDETDYARRFLDHDVAPYGVELWPAAEMLAEHIAGDRALTAGTALELGCGVGLVSIVAAKLGWRITASDYEPTALAFAAYNAKINQAPIAEWMQLDWRNPPGDRTFDCLLAADVLYQLIDHQPIIDCIDALLAPNGSAFISDPNRGVADRFPLVAEASGLVVDTITLDVIHFAGKSREGRLFRVYRPARRRERP